MCFAFYTEIQDGHQKLWESVFCKMSPIHSADTLWVKNFVEIALTRTVSEINALWHFTWKFKMAAKVAGSDFCLTSPVDSSYTMQAKNFVKIAPSRSVSEIGYAEIQHGCQKWQESDFCEKLSVHSILFCTFIALNLC